jgi:hypothetical protein
MSQCSGGRGGDGVGLPTLSVYVSRALVHLEALVSTLPSAYFSVWSTA